MIRPFVLPFSLAASVVLAGQSLTVPAGTRIALALTSPLASRTARVGDMIRAQTAFPVAVGAQTAIPTGAYVEGKISRAGHKGLSRRPVVQIRFQRLIYPNGYVILLAGASAEAPFLAKAVAEPSSIPPSAFALQQFPTPPTDLPPPPAPLPQQHMKTGKGLFIGLAAASVAGAVLTALLLHRGPDLYLEAGAQMEMVLEAPLTIDLARAGTT